MSTTNYGAMGAASYDPKQFVLKALKKIQLNSRNAEKYFRINDTDGIRNRLINSLHLLEELDMMLNRDIENAAVTRVSTHYQWLMEVYEEIINEDEIEEKKFIEIIEMSEIVIKNLYEGFAGMKDDGDDMGEQND